MRQKVLIISFSLPPYPDIGGRRWAKYCKELYREGYDIQVIAFHFGRGSNSANWLNDISKYTDRITYLPSFYPRWLGQPKTFFQKVMYRLSLFYVKIFAKGNYYDRASFVKKILKKTVSKKIEQGYKNIIVSCAPFKLALWISELKSRRPDINFIVDFRDPWVDNKVLYGLHSMPIQRQVFEREAEKKVIQAADHVVSVAPEMTQYFRSLQPESPNKFVTIENGFDEDDFQNIRNLPEKSPVSDKLKFIFVGSLYNKALHHVHELINALDYLKKENHEAYNNMQFDFYGNYSSEIIRQSQRHKNMRFTGNIPNQLVYQKIKESTICMTFLTDEITYCFNTKFFEYLSQRKPIAIFSKPGSASEYILNNKLGYALEPGKVQEVLLKIFHDFEQGTLKNNISFDIDHFSVKKLSKQFEKLLK